MIRGPLLGRFKLGALKIPTFYFISVLGVGEFAPLKIVGQIRGLFSFG